MTIRGGGNPHTAVATMPLGEWTRRLGALLAEAYDRSGPIQVQPDTSVVHGRLLVANGRLPSDHGAPNPPDRRQFAVALASVKDKPSAALKKRRP